MNISDRSIYNGFMDVATAQQNAAVLYDHPNAIFKSGKNGQLMTISQYNFIGRFIEWVKDKVSGGERSERVNALILKTFDIIEPSQTFPIKLKGYVKEIQQNVHIRELADKIAASQLDGNKALHSKMDEIQLKYIKPAAPLSWLDRDLLDRGLAE